MPNTASIRAVQRYATCQPTIWPVNSLPPKIAVPAGGRAGKHAPQELAGTGGGVWFQSKTRVSNQNQNLVFRYNQLSGVGRYRSQFNVDAGGVPKF